MIHIAIVEDEPSCQKQLCAMLERFATEYTLAIQTEVFSDGLRLLDNYRPAYDVVLMDIQMPGMDGLSASRRLREMDPDVILVFITNLAQYALKGYEVQAYDFVVKPVTYPALAQKLTKIVRLLARRPAQYVLLQLYSPAE